MEQPKQSISMPFQARFLPNFDLTKTLGFSTMALLA